MKFKVAFLTLFLIVCFSPLAAQTCPRGHARSLAYIFRDGNRCEGFRDRTASGTPELIAFSTSSLGEDYPDRINIRVPGTDNTPPTIQVQSHFRNYRLDNLETNHGHFGFTFSLDPYVLRNGNVLPSSLRAVAYILSNSSPVYYPVILGEPTGRYEFVIHVTEDTVFPTFEIRHGNNSIYSGNYSGLKK